MSSEMRIHLPEKQSTASQPKRDIPARFQSFVAQVLFVLAAGMVPGCSCNNDVIGGGPPPLPPDMSNIGCGLRTCENAVPGGAKCGPIGDGCGGTVECGDCPFPSTCGGGGVPYECGGTAACTPAACDTIPANCGTQGDGCGKSITCGDPTTGACTDPSLTCGGGGVANVCGTGGGCQPATRTAACAGKTCGFVGDGCGGSINCGSCTAPQTCGGAGMAFQCGTPSVGACTPKTCANVLTGGANCGYISDGCGGTLSCGTCTKPGDTCGGGTVTVPGKPNVCGGAAAGPACTTALCMAQAASMCPGTMNNVPTVVTGVVRAPTPATFLPAGGKADPIYGALVYVPNAAVAAFTPGVSCDKCTDTVSGSPLVAVTTGPDGKFTLSNVPPGTNIPLVIQLGRWRRQITIPTVTACQTNMLPDEPPSMSDKSVRLPRTKAEGDIPLFAVTTGDADAVECVLRKIGIADSEFTLPSGNGRVRMYREDGIRRVGGNNLPSYTNLINSQTELNKHDAVIFDCVGSQSRKTATQLSNVVNYTNAGGRIFATHYEYVYLDQTAAYNGTVNWQVNNGSPANGKADINTLTPKGAAFAQWLANAGATAAGSTQIDVQQVRRDNMSVITPPTELWLTYNPVTQFPLEFTFNTPVGQANQCGRVLFSDFHVSQVGSTGDFPGACNNTPMTPQEKVLEFMVFDLTSCIAPTTPPVGCTPKKCSDLGATCGPQGDGCGNLISCGSCPTGQVCTGTPSMCVASSCANPLTCTSQNINCGAAGDGCGNLLDCGTCPVGQSCGGGGMPGRCGAGGSCIPKTCTALGIGCGPAGDGCGGTLNCGTCSGGQTCGGAGVAGQCGTPPCSTPITCSDVGATCGKIGNGCGGTLDCGTCSAPDTCGGGGKANVCGSIG